MLYSRRAAVAALLLYGGGLRGQGLDRFAGSEPPCGPDQALTPALTPDGTFVPGAPWRTALTPAGFSGPTITVSGTIAGITCGRIRDAEVDIWQAGPGNAAGSAGSFWNGRQRTDVNGRYRVTTVRPPATAGRAPHLGLRVVVPNKAEFWTEAFFPADGGNARDPRYRPKLVMKPVVGGFLFDIVLNL